jgi:uncharacterized protein (TIGR00661 family)
VVGEGMGHATRSRVVLTHLLAQGHTAKIVVSGRAFGYLQRYFPDVEEIHGLRIVYEDNAVSRHRTVWDFLKALPRNVADNFDKYEAIADGFNPDVVISDFESFAYFFAKRRQKPVLSIDNMQIINRCQHEEDLIPEDLRASFGLTKTIVKSKLPFCDHYFITSFFFPPLRKERTSLYPPILRDEMLAARATAARGDHVVVYQTSDSYKDLVPTLGRMGGEFRVYGLLRGDAPEEDVGKVRLRRFSETGFVDDLKTCRAVIAGGGYSLMGEAVYLGKPMLSVPVGKQFEQTLNALYLQKLGYGEYHRQLSQEAMGAFLERAPEYAKHLEAHHQDGNQALFTALDAALADVAAGRLRPTGESEEE